PPPSPSDIPLGCPRPLRTVTRLRYGSIGLREKENSKSFPSPSGTHWSMLWPFPTKKNPRRRMGAAAVSASGVIAGTIASRSGSATAAPIPRNNVRRSRCFFVRNIGRLLEVCLHRELEQAWSENAARAQPVRAIRRRDAGYGVVVEQIE